MQKLRLFLTVVFTAVLFNLPAQEKAENNKHLSLGTGFSQITFRDLATSPLFYSGMGVNLLASTEISNQNWSHHWGFEGIFGVCNSIIPTDMEFSATTSSSLSAINLRYQALRKLTQMSTEKQQLWLGGEALFSTPFVQTKA